MKTSARNQFSGKVSRLTSGAINDEVEIALANGQTIVAIITHESVKNLGLAVGKEAFALIKASSIIIVADGETAKFSTRNRLAGKVSKLQTGAVNTEVVIDLPNGGAIASIITNESASSLGLAVGKPASAIFKASSVIVATA
jgi:molybdate transport system regulatory protein